MSRSLPADEPALRRALACALLAGWAFWTSVVSATNIFDALRELGVLPADWRAASGNFRWIARTTDVYHVPAWGNAVMFGGVILWEVTIAALLWRAVAKSWRGGPSAPAATLLGFLVSLPLWLAFMVADEVFIEFAPEETHLRILIAQLATLLLLLALRQRSDADPVP